MKAQDLQILVKFGNLVAGSLGCFVGSIFNYLFGLSFCATKGILLMQDKLKACRHITKWTFYDFTFIRLFIILTPVPILPRNNEFSFFQEEYGQGGSSVNT